MIDPRREAILIWSDRRGAYEDKTAEAVEYRLADGKAHVTLTRADGTHKTYPYDHPGRVLILSGSSAAHPDAHQWVEVDGERWHNVTEIVALDDGAGQAWCRVFYTTKKGQAHRIHPAERVRLRTDAAQGSTASAILSYWKALAEALPGIDKTEGQPNPLRAQYEGLGQVHPDSVLGRYLNGEPLEAQGHGAVPIFPFSSNISQRDAVHKALENPVSLIEGPPGTGKTQTILNLLATLISEEGVSIGVVSSNNAAVANVCTKLGEAGFGYVLAALGNRQNREEFFAGQEPRNEVVEATFSEDSETEIPDADQLAELDRKLDHAQRREREQAKLRGELDAHRLEQRHFERYLDGHDITAIDGLPLLRRSSERIVEFLAESPAADADDPLPLRWLRRLRWLLRYGPLRGTDPRDTDLLLTLQRTYYERKIAELTEDLERLELDRVDLEALIAQQQDLSERYFRGRLRARYAGRERREYDANSYRRDFARFIEDYPVILSTCHSLRHSMKTDHLFDYLIIDEASQVDLLAAGLALASCRRAVIVGDLRQLPHIPQAEAVTAAGPAPHPSYDYERHSILSSLVDLYGEQMPRTLLREHYRCDPAIIGFCNEQFYGGELIPLTVSIPGSRPLSLHPTVEGNHMRYLLQRGLFNRREIEVIRDEVIPDLSPDVGADQIGIATPFRQQVSEIDSQIVASAEGIEVDTVHRFQGREKRVMIVSTVLDETAGERPMGFADDPHLVNVAVSRAVERLVLVTDHEMLPRSRNLRDLMEYIRYRDPERYRVESSVVSVFDLLYRRHSEKLRTLKKRLRGEMPNPAEDIVWTLLHDILEEEPYVGLRTQPQLLLRNLLPDLGRLTAEEAAFVSHGASVDFVVYRGISRTPLLAIEVDGFAYHENDPRQLARDALKDAILAEHGLPLLRLPTTGSGEAERIREALDQVLVSGA